MRKNRIAAASNDFTILALDDDPIMTATLQSYFQTSGYRVEVENDPFEAIERVREGSFDILLLDFLMSPHLRGRGRCAHQGVQHGALYHIAHGAQKPCPAHPRDTGA